jgi:hypothetical protein
MSAISIARPVQGEFAKHFEGYVAQVPETDIIAVLRAQTGEIADLVKNIPEERGGFRYGPDKWTIREVLGHLADTERVMSYRATCLARGEQNELPGFDENEYVRSANFDQWTLADLAAQFETLRRANVAVLEHLDSEAWSRRGIVNRNLITVPAIAWVMAGHVRHHVKILKERYGV